MQTQGDIAVVGLAVMGQNLILNMNDHGFRVVALNRTVVKVDDFIANEAKGTNVVGAHSLAEACAMLKRPRRVLLMVKAGASFALFVVGLVAAAVLAFAAPACQPNLADTVSIVTTARVLAIQSVPAEAPPAARVAYTALVAQGNRPDAGPDAGPPPLSWDYCTARNPLKNLGPVSTLCVQQGNSALVSIGSGPSASAPGFFTR